jgi:hypothetical protein
MMFCVRLGVLGFRWKQGAKQHQQLSLMPCAIARCFPSFQKPQVYLAKLGIISSCIIEYTFLNVLSLSHSRLLTVDMNVFLTSLMHKNTAHDFSVVEHNFELTARSICSQTDQNFLLIVVCCSIPQINFEHKNIHYHTVDFLPATNTTDTTSKRIDKATKIVSGLLYLKKYNPNYVHIFDADDWVSRKLNAFLNNSPLNKVGWYISSGYVVDLSTNRRQLKYGLNRYCGSTFICNFTTLMKCLSIKSTLRETSTQEEILKYVPKHILLDVIDSHGYLEFYSSNKLSYKKVPFNALTWVRNTGENILSDGSTKEGLYIDSKFLSLFGLEGIVATCNSKSSLIERVLHALSSICSFLGWSAARTKDNFLQRVPPPPKIEPHNNIFSTN